MKKFILLLLVALSTLATFAQVHVRGYTRSNGTYVAPYTRSSPDKSPYNNYSYPGNKNPYTGKVAIGNPDTYLNNYYNRTSSTSNSSSGLSLNSTSVSTTATYPPTTYPTTYPNNNSGTNSGISRNPLESPLPSPDERAATKRANQHIENALLAKKKYLKDKTGHYTGEYLQLSEEDDTVKKYGLYDGNDFQKGTLLVYANGDRLLLDNFGHVIAQNKSKR